MYNRSQRERLIEQLKKNTDLRMEVPDYVVEAASPEDEENYRLLAGHWRYLMRKKRSASEEEKKELSKQLFDVEQYMKIAQFGDRNIERFIN